VIVHRDLKPDNLLLGARGDGTALLKIPATPSTVPPVTRCAYVRALAAQARAMGGAGVLVVGRRAASGAALGTRVAVLVEGNEQGDRGAEHERPARADHPPGERFAACPRRLRSITGRELDGDDVDTKRSGALVRELKVAA
jgi:hypothetical protein